MAGGGEQSGTGSGGRFLGICVVGGGLLGIAIGAFLGSSIDQAVAGAIAGLSLGTAIGLVSGSLLGLAAGKTDKSQPKDGGQ
jgi:hypothetical protein